MGKKITPDQLGAEVQKILSKYGDEVEDNLDTIKRQIANKGKTALKNESLTKFNGTGKYAKGWTVTMSKKPHYTSAIIHNTKPGLTHLLEHGHALIVGGRSAGKVEGRPHIEPVETELVNSFINEVCTKL